MIFLFKGDFFYSICMPEYLLDPQYQGNSLISREREYLYAKYILIKTTFIEFQHHL